MKLNLKDIGSYILGIGIFIGICLLPVLFINGGLWLSVIIYPWLFILSLITLTISILILFPLATFRKTREASATGLLIASYIFGTTAWIWSFILAYISWGFIGLFIGLFMAGVGVVPIAMLATIFHGEWTALWQLTLLVAFTFGFRFFAIFLSEKTEQQSNNDDSAFFIKNYPDNVLQSLASVNIDTDYRSVYKTVNDLISIHPDCGKAYYYKGHCLIKLKKYKEAIETYNKAIEICPTSDLSGTIRTIAHAYATLLNIEINEDNYPTSLLDVLNEATTRSPDAFLYNYLGRGFYYWESYIENGYEKAIECFDKAIELNPNLGSAWFNKGETLCIQGKNQKSLKMFDKAIELNPTFDEAYFTKGLILARIGKYPEAIKMINYAIKLNPNEKQYHDTKNDLLIKLKNPADGTKN